MLSPRESVALPLNSDLSAAKGIEIPSHGREIIRYTLNRVERENLAIISANSGMSAARARVTDEQVCVNVTLIWNSFIVTGAEGEGETKNRETNTVLR